MKMDNKKETVEKWTGSLLSYGLLAFCAGLAVIVTFLVYQNTQQLLESRLKARLTAIVSTAALQFDPEEVDKIVNESNVGSAPFVNVTNQLIDIRNTNSDIRFAYLLRPTYVPEIFEFIADSHSLYPYDEIDLNNDGIIDESDALVVPGEEYDASEAPVLVEQAILYPSVDDELIQDQWGILLASYAPIKSKGKTIAVLGIDVDVSDFINRTGETLVPFVLLVSFLLLLLSVLTIFLVRMWGSRVSLLRELDRQKDELLSIVSHQLATPISAVKWNLEMILDGDMGKLNKDQEKHLRTVYPQTQDLADLAAMILDVSRIQLGRMKVDRAKLDFAELAKEIFEGIKPKADEKKLHYTLSIPKPIPVAMFDRRLTRMALDNLLNNAVGYTPEKGKVELHISVKGKTLCYEVRDTGCGIPKKDRDKIFGKLFRASNVLNTEGNGFGLYIAKGAVEAQGGKIWFSSAENKGTTFHVQLPFSKLNT